MTDKVTLSFSDSGIATVKISNPPLNIYDLEMRDGLIEAFTATRDNPAARALILKQKDHISAQGQTFPNSAQLRRFLKHAKSDGTGTRGCRCSASQFLPLLR